MVVGDALGFILALQLKLIVLYEDWKLPEKDAKNGFILANPANKPTVHYEIWLFGGGSFDLPHLHRRIPQ